MGERMERDGIVHHGIELQFGGERHRLPLSDLTGGRSIVIYGQTEVVKDLIAARVSDDLPLHFEVDDVSVHDLESERPRIRYRRDGAAHELECDVIAGCDGFHGVCRATIPGGVLRTFEREYPFGWLGILAAVAPSSDELVYAHHERGFALLSLRSPELSRLYLQCRPDEEIGAWSDDRIWSELQQRLGIDGWTLDEGPVLEKGVTGMRSFVAEPMRHGRLFLTGDAAHIVPPTGAKGLNLAIHDVRTLAAALIAWYERGSADLLDGYSDTCLRRVWRAEHFSWWMTSMLHRSPGRRRLRPAPAALAAALPDAIAGGRGLARRELRRPRGGLGVRRALRAGGRPRGGVGPRLAAGHARRRASARRDGGLARAGPGERRRVDRLGVLRRALRRRADRARGAPSRHARRGARARAAGRGRAARTRATSISEPRARTSWTARRCWSRSARSPSCSPTSRPSWSRAPGSRRHTARR